MMKIESHAIKLFASFAFCLLLVLMFAGCSGKQGPKPVEAETMTDQEYADAMAKEHAADSPEPSGAAEGSGGVLATTGSVTAFGTAAGKEVRGYLATPNEPGAHPGVILIHEWWGLNENIKVMADRLASQGYRVLAVDLYGGVVATTPDEAKAAMSGVDPASAKETLRVAHQFLVDAGAQAVGVMGWCFGGGWALETGLLLGESIDAVVMYYGRPKATAAELEPLAAPLLGFFGAKDDGISVEQVRQFEAALEEVGADARIEIYADAGHAFANPSGNNYVESAATDAWEKALAFFAEHLSASGAAPAAN